MGMGMGIEIGVLFAKMQTAQPWTYNSTLHAA
jgi:hypothetical protein